MGPTSKSCLLGDHRRKTLQRGGTFGRYLPSGHLIYVNRGTLFAVPFDLDTLSVRGTPTPVLEQVAYDSGFGHAQFDFSRNGTLIYRTGRAAGALTVQWLDAAGKTQPLLAKPSDYDRPQLSPDGNRLALVSAGGIWVHEWKRDAKTLLTSDGAPTYPLWSPDGRYIFFQDARGGMFWTRSDGAGKPQPLTQSRNPQYPWSFTADSKRLAFMEVTPGNGFDLVYPPNGKRWRGVQGRQAGRFPANAIRRAVPVLLS
jgi:hypothetical protein